MQMLGKILLLAVNVLTFVNSQQLALYFSCPEETGWFPSEESCKDYYGCSGNMAWKYTCPDGTVWDTSTGICNGIDNVDCKKEDSSDKPDDGNDGETDGETDSETDDETDGENDGEPDGGTDGEFGDKDVSCYFINWAWYRTSEAKYSADDVDPTLCTIINYAFVVLQDNKIKVHDPWADTTLGGGEFFKKIVALRNVTGSRVKKVLVALGGWNDSAGSKYSNLVKSKTLRKEFNKHALKFVKQHGFDGIDLDWEYPACWQGVCATSDPYDMKNFATWVKELKKLFTGDQLMVTAAVSASLSIIDAAYDVPKLAKHLDLLNIMTYDFHGSGDSVTGHNSPLYSCNGDLLNSDTAVKHWIDNGFPANKILLGLGIYGRTFTLSSGTNNGIGAPVTGAGKPGPWTDQEGYMGYYEICLNVIKNNWKKVEGSECTVGPYAYKGDQWVGFDDLETVKVKMSYIKEMGLRGGMVWDITMDDFKGNCGDGKNPFLTTMRKYLSPSETYNDDDNNDHDEVAGECDTKSAKDLKKNWQKLPSSGTIRFSVNRKAIKNGSNAQLKCRKGFQMNGSKTLTCNYGNWGQLPTCEKPTERCSKKSVGQLKKAVEKIKNAANVMLTDSKGNFTATIICNKGHEILGENIVTCNNNSWEKLPFCVREGGVGQYLTREQFEEMFPNRNEGGKSEFQLYEYEFLLEAASEYPSFAREGSEKIRRREIALFLANIAQETKGGWADVEGGRNKWGLYFLEEAGWAESGKVGYCNAFNVQYPCQAGKSYHGRGPIQLSWNHNYGQMSEKIFGNKMELLNNPERVGREGKLAFQTALWFWMTPQSPKPSCHDAITGMWNPSDADKACGRGIGFGGTIDMINGALECGMTMQDIRSSPCYYSRGYSQENVTVCN